MLVVKATPYELDDRVSIPGIEGVFLFTAASGQSGIQQAHIQ
jgi:hypothetical protein